jgi:hypothetical protein
MMFVPHRKHTPPRLVTGDSFTFVHVDDVRTSQYAYASTACDWDGFTFAYVDNIRASQEAYASMDCYGDSFTFVYVDDVRTSQ